MSIPVIAHGGCGSYDDIKKIFDYSYGDAVAVGSMFVFQKKGMGVLINYPTANDLKKFLICVELLVFKSNKNNFCSKKLIIEQVKLLQHRGLTIKVIYWKKNITLGHTRLSILDLSNKANQPMFSDCGRYVMTYNGEVYNFKNIKKNLKN